MGDSILIYTIQSYLQSYSWTIWLTILYIFKLYFNKWSSLQPNNYYLYMFIFIFIQFKYLWFHFIALIHLAFLSVNLFRQNITHFPQITWLACYCNSFIHYSILFLQNGNVIFINPGLILYFKIFHWFFFLSLFYKRFPITEALELIYFYIKYFKFTVR